MPEGYIADVLIPWGTPIRPGGPAWKKDASNTAAEQAQQVGMHHDANCYFPIGRGRDGNRRGLLVTNHEYTDNTLLYPDGNAVLTQEKVDKAIAAHGVSIVEIELQAGQVAGGRLPVRPPHHRRHPGPLLRPGDRRPPAAAVQQRADGHAQQLLVRRDAVGHLPGLRGELQRLLRHRPTPRSRRPRSRRATASPARARTGGTRSTPGSTSLANPNEVNRFGWVVEIDPFKPDAKPVKRTALGRFKHEGATVWESRGRVVVYSGDDQDDDYVYKFVSSGPWRWLRALGRSPLDHGTLYVGKFNDDGTGQWLPLVFGEGPLTTANGWADQADVLIRTRQAADAVGATKLDRPEWITVHPKTDAVYMSLTNSTVAAGERGQPAPPEPVRPHHPVARTSTATRPGSTSSGTSSCSPATRQDHRAHPAIRRTRCPRSPTRIGSARRTGSGSTRTVDCGSRPTSPTRHASTAGGYDRIGNNQMLAADPTTGEVRRFLVGPRGCEITGIDLTPDQRTMFVNVQHPGESRRTVLRPSPTPANPRAVSNWPDFDPDGRPRSATVVVRKRDGGVIGT